jgi:hypothetical protein
MASSWVAATPYEPPKNSCTESPRTPATISAGSGSAPQLLVKRVSLDFLVRDRVRVLQPEKSKAQMNRAAEIPSMLMGLPGALERTGVRVSSAGRPCPPDCLTLMTHPAAGDGSAHSAQPRRVTRRSPHHSDQLADAVTLPSLGLAAWPSGPLSCP